MNGQSQVANDYDSEEDLPVKLKDLSVDSHSTPASSMPSRSTSPSPLQPTIHDLETRCKHLLNELETFRTHLRSLNRESMVDTGTLRHTLQSELKSLQRASSLATETSDGGVNERTTHLLRSSNLPFLEAVWETAKRSTAVTAFSKRMYWDTKAQRSKTTTNGHSVDDDGDDNADEIDQQAQQKKHHAEDGLRHRRNFANVDVVTHAGAEWVKISSVSETRLIFEMAGQGWHEDDSLDGSEDSDEASDAGSLASINAASNNNGTSSISIVRMAENLARAARATRVRYKHPRVRFILSKITPGRVPQVDALLAAVRATGAILETAADHPSTTTTTTVPISSALPHMISSPYSTFTATLNIDCTILLALVSDLSHTRSIPTEPWFHKAMRRQIEREEAENLLPSVLYPAMAGRRLVCTEEAAQRMREIVATIGTETEKGRMRLLLGDDTAGNEEERRKTAAEGMAKLSQYAVPADWHIPVTIISASSSNSAPPLPILAFKISPHLSPINQSIFLFGWRMGYTTITSNRTVVKQIDRLVKDELDREEAAGRGVPAVVESTEMAIGGESGGAGVGGGLGGSGVGGGSNGNEEEVGPDVWVCTCSRSLIGKEKGRKH